MDMMLDEQTGSIIACFKPREVSDAANLLRSLLLEGGAWDQTAVGDFNEEFFEEFASSEKKVCILFSFKLLPLAIRLMEVVIDITAENGGDTESLENFFIQVKEWHNSAHPMQ